MAGLDFGLADDDAILGNLGGVRELIAEALVGQDDVHGKKLIGAVAQSSGKLLGIRNFVLGNGDDGEVDGRRGGVGEEASLAQDEEEAGEAD